jgi:hypothetical protein
LTIAIRHRSRASLSAAVDPGLVRADAVLLGPAPHEPLQPFEPDLVDRLVGRPAVVAASRLDLAGDQHVAVAQDQVELALGAPPVAVEQGHAPLAGEVARGDVLAVGTQRQSAGSSRRHVVTSWQQPGPGADGPAGTCEQAVDSRRLLVSCARQVD